MEHLSHMEKETIAEVGNISLGAAASALSLILNRRVNITAPNLEIHTVSQIKQSFPLPCLLVEVSYLSGLQGNNVLLIKQEDALVIAGLMMGMPGVSSLGEMEISAIQEAMNQMMGYMATSMSEMFGQVVEITPPKLTSCIIAEQEFTNIEESSLAVQVSFSIKVEGAIDSKLIQIIPLDFAKNMAAFLLSDGEATLEAAFSEEAQEVAVETGPVNNRIQDTELPAATFHDGKQSPSGELLNEGNWNKLDIAREIPLEVTVILGKSRML
ncbi:MAG TPA: flagellar motor switch phosphatase FliY, partial [Firmicutes bacterium]|nr:flagellar motor switch phosphatase FliY [Bacillota bacterium]